MRKIDAGKLANRAENVLRAVHEEAAEYIVMVEGEPVAVLRPVTAADSAMSREEIDRQLAEIDALAEEIAANWTGDKTPREMLAQQRGRDA